MSKALDILHIEDSEDDSLLVKLALRELEFEVDLKRVETLSGLQQALSERDWDLILCDHNLPSLTMEDAFSLALENNPMRPFILVTGAIGDEATADIMRLGVNDIVLKENLKRLPSVILRNMREADIRQEIRVAQKSLRESQLRYQTLWENSTTGYMLTSKGVIVDCNQTLCDQWGYSKEEIVGKTPGEFSPPQQPDSRSSLELAQRLYDDAAAASQPTFRWVHQHRDGTPIHYSITLNRLRLGERWLVVGGLLDVSEQVANQETLALQDRALQCTNNGVVICRYDGQTNPITWANAAFLRMSGYTMEEIIGQDSLFLQVEDASAKDIKRIRDTMARGSSATTTLKSHRKSGRVFWNELRLDPVYSEKGVLTHYIVIQRDITETVEAEEKIKRSEALLHAAGEIARVGGWEIDVINDVISWTDITREIHGVPDDYVPEMDSALKFFPPPYDKIVRQSVEHSIETGEPFDFESPFINSSGRLIWVRSLGIAVMENGQCTYLRGAFQDITERKATEQAIEQSRQRLAMAIELGNLAVWDYNVLEKRLVLEDSWYKLFGYPQGEDFGQLESMHDLVAEDERSQIRFSFQRLLSGQEQKITEECFMRCGDGSMRRVLLRAQALHDNEGRLTQVLGNVWDIDERWRSEERLRLFQRLINQSPSSVVVTDPQGNVEYVNDTFCRITGYSREEALGENPRLLKSNRMDPKHYSQMWKAITNGREWQGEFLNKKKNGEYYWERAIIFPIKGRNGAITHFAGAKEDITELKENEIKREELNKQVLQLQRMETIGTLAGGIAHDFNNLLGAIRGWTELAQRHVEGNDNAREDLRHVLVATKRARALVEQILTFSRESIGNMIPIDPAMVANEAMNMLRSIIPTTIIINKDIPQGLGQIKADPSQFHQIIFNLCTNASQAMGDKGGELQVSLSHCEVPHSNPDSPSKFPGGSCLCLKVSDTGPGIPKEHLNRIFEPFFTTKPVGEGTGLGLSVVHGIVASHQGDITVQSELGEGTTFQLYFPCIKEGPAEDQLPEVEEKPQGGSERILLVDDEREIINVMQRHLTFLGYDVTIFSESPEAEKAFLSAPDDFDILVTDQVMPNLTGLELIEKIRTVRPDFPAVIMTGFSRTVSPERMEMLKRSSVIMKPYSLTDLTKTIRSLLEDETAKQDK
ncbi:PAS domain S-box protein [Ruficoccus sp. ZRK36]|uniref:PAS domain S-box protein n=1 Tax=Ruficoccus sp. ZRK36 TaxID=2866311 RepID=UPI001C72DC14|nr:PAS domain S-box protein [Ruficoccus sp. ZRK36]QYY36541.1 PAS domain S-box protein [Ruficoccus sp. ZRK36]